ncbi:hypothetical protein S7711_07153 [Stachybotrys chartarum IBT 7711]|uniref:FAD-binding PCMH-type domain-containing protein n=1 Tax=Stachybotrys chartarum (strain CBS 109288 / IBT 7711) TaxID=1280523 RepID=A0A084BAH1_STACB|nr:hypothetical protein S7711_07153 [Stachybotrys chartarum IBT 7711]
MHIPPFFALILVFKVGVVAQSLDDFLASIGIEADAITSEAKRGRGTPLACQVLSVASEHDPMRITTPADGDVYTQQAQAHWSATAYKSPACIFSPEDVDGLALAIRVAKFTESRFAVRSGGHSPLAGWANINDHLLISMSNFRDLSYDETTQTLRTGIGNRWADVYESLVPHGRVVVGGRLGDVGLGLVTGGGLSHLSNAHGWASQNIISYEILLSNLSHVVASASENPELYFSIKAGSSNFGIVTHVTQRTFEAGPVWGGTMIISGNYTTQFMAAIAEYQEIGQLDTKSAILPYIGINNHTIIQTFVYFDAVEYPDAFRPFYDIPVLVDQTQVYTSFYEFANLEIAFAVPRWTFAATTMELNAEAYMGLVGVFQQFTTRMQAIEGGTLAPMAQPISRSMIEESVNLGEDPMNVEPTPQLCKCCCCASFRNQPLISKYCFVGIGINTGWSLERDDKAAYGITQDCLEAVERYTKSLGVYLPFVFLNDAFHTQRPFQSYGQSSLSRLRAASIEYDSEQVFQNLVPGGFKLWK